MKTKPESPKPRPNRPQGNPAMKAQPASPKTPLKPLTPRKHAIWELLGGTSLSISMLLHLVLVVVGLFIVFEVIQEPKKTVDFMPPSGGGGSPASEAISRKHTVKMTQSNMARVAAAGAMSNVVLPEPDEHSQMASVGSVSSGGLSGGLGGDGSGGGKGDGNGLGTGGGFARGMGDGNGIKNPFGMIGGKGALKGTLYDLKQTHDRKPTNMTDDRFHVEIKEIVYRGFKDSFLRKYYKAPRELAQTMLHIPIISADLAPAAFECQNEVQPRHWVVVYRGAVQAPRTGRFRFVGAADDLLVVRFNNRTVFDFGYTLASVGQQLVGRSSELDGTKENKELAKEIRRSSPMVLPIRFYQYKQTPTFNGAIGGYAVGPEFQVVAGKTYPIEILVGEVPGGFFGVSLLIEEIGAVYEKDSTGSPILPLFRLDNSPPSDQLKGECPPIAPIGPLWKFVPGSLANDI